MKEMDISPVWMCFVMVEVREDRKSLRRKNRN